MSHRDGAGGSVMQTAAAETPAPAAGAPPAGYVGWLLGCGALALLLAAASLLVGSSDWRTSAGWLLSPDALSNTVLWQIRAPRTLGAWCAGALLALAGALAQGLFRNPLADPYLLGSASGAALGVAVSLVAAEGSIASLAWAGRIGITSAAFVGACAAIGLTIALARGVLQTLHLLLAGVVVGFVLTAITSLLLLASPDAWRAMQAFLLGSTGYLGWPATALLAGVLVACAVPALLLSRGLDALTLGEDTARSLGVALPALRLALLGLLSLATATAVAQVGVVGFIGLAAPHLVRQRMAVDHRRLLVAAAASGGVLLQAADLLSRWAVRPAELPVGAVTACLGGAYLVALLWRRSAGGLSARRAGRSPRATASAAPMADGAAVRRGTPDRTVAGAADRRDAPGAAAAADGSPRGGDRGSRAIAIGCRDLRAGYGSRVVFDDVTLDIAAGAWTAVVGPNGCGKSTLLRVLAGLHPARRGGVQLAGRPLADWPRRERAKRLAWLDQQAPASAAAAGDLNVADCVALGRFARTGWLGAPAAADRAAVARAMEATGCTGWADRRVATLSGGERQRVLLARALAVEAPLLLLDEPSAHLDPPHQEAVARLLRRLAHGGGAAVVGVVHELSLALAADRLVVLGAHGLVGHGSVDEALAGDWLSRAFGTPVEVVDDRGVRLWRPYVVAGRTD